jgi:CHRD domain
MRSRIILVLAALAIAVTLLAGGAVASYQGTNDHGGPKGKHAVDTKALFTVLAGRNEVDDQGRRGAGDPDGRGSFTAIVDGDQLYFGITVTNLDAPVAAHIHKGRPNQNGPIIVTLTAPTTGDPGASSGCTTVDPDVSRAILKNPHKYYVNVHTGAFPNGAARGQLFRKSH